MPDPQPAILRPPPATGRFVTFAKAPGTEPGAVLRRLGEARHDPRTVVGFGCDMVARAGLAVPGLRPFPMDLSLFPSTQASVWLFLAHGDRSASFDAGRAFALLLGSGFRVVDEVDSFRYRKKRDLSGFEDGTENPKGAKARAAAIVDGAGAGLDGGSFVAVQRWVHDLGGFLAMSEEAQSAAIGRRKRDNREMPDAPRSSHVKRTEQESFEPEAFVLRRSMPWGGVAEHGLYFVAYGESLDRFERQLRRMAGRDDGIVDAVTAFSRAHTGGYYFCPPVRNGRLHLRGLGI